MYLKCAFTYIKRGKRKFEFLKCKEICNFKNKYISYSTSTNDKSQSVLFFGNSEFSLSSMKELDTTYRDKGLLRRLEVVTNNKFNPVSKYAIKNNIKIHYWQSDINFKEFDIGVVVSFGYLIPSRILEQFPLGLINVHGSLLPKWRGAAPIAHSLMNGETRTGVSIIKLMPKKFDVGSIIMQKEVEIYSDETQTELSKRLSELGADLLIETMTKLPDVLDTAVSQPKEGVTYAPKISKDMSFIKWDVMTAKNIYNLQRGLDGIEPLRTYFNDKVVKLLDIQVVTETMTISSEIVQIPGLIMYNKRNQILYVSCRGNTWITVGSVIIPDHKPKSAIQFCSGFVLKYKNKNHLFY